MRSLSSYVAKPIAEVLASGREEHAFALPGLIPRPVNATTL